VTAAAAAAAAGDDDERCRPATVINDRHLVTNKTKSYTQRLGIGTCGIKSYFTRVWCPN